MEPSQQVLSAITLLIAEDNNDAREVTSLMISRRFPEITIYLAENGEIAVDLFKEHAADIVITDLNMPVMDGFQMAGEIKAIKADTKFILLTGYNDKKSLDLFSAIGVSHYLPKPLEFIKLFAAIKECIAEVMMMRHQ